MHYNDQPVTTPDAIPVEPVQPTNSPTNTVPGNYPNEIKSDSKQSETAATDTSDYKDKEDPKDDDDKETPEWFMKDKFKSIEEQAMSYKELSSKMGKFWGTPSEGYKVEGLDGITEDDPIVAGLMPALKQMGVSQEGFHHLAGQYLEATRAMMGQMEADLKKTLTETDAHTYQSITKWMDESMSPEEATQIKNNWLMTADDFKLFNNIRLMLAPSTNVPNNQSNAVKYESSKEVENDKIKYKKELKAGTRVQDKNHEDNLAARFRDAITRELRHKGR